MFKQLKINKLGKKVFGYALYVALKINQLKDKQFI